MLMPPPHAAQWAVIQKPVQFDEFFDSFFVEEGRRIVSVSSINLDQVFWMILESDIFVAE